MIIEINRRLIANAQSMIVTRVCIEPGRIQSSIPGNKNKALLPNPYVVSRTE